VEVERVNVVPKAKRLKKANTSLERRLIQTFNTAQKGFKNRPKFCKNGNTDICVAKEIAPSKMSGIFVSSWCEDVDLIR